MQIFRSAKTCLLLTPGSHGTLVTFKITVISFLFHGCKYYFCFVSGWILGIYVAQNMHLCFKISITCVWLSCASNHYLLQIKITIPLSKVSPYTFKKNSGFLNPRVKFHYQFDKSVVREKWLNVTFDND